MVDPRHGVLPVWNAPARVHAFTTTTMAGNFASHTGDDARVVGGRRERLRQQHALRAIAWLDQVHGTTVVSVGEEKPVDTPIADAAWTELVGIACVVLTADCVPILVSDLDGRVVGAAHGGWRGLVGGVVGALIHSMPVQAERLVAWLGPAIGKARYEIGADVATAIEASIGARAAGRVLMPSHEKDKWHADLVALARLHLEALGVAWVATADACTYEDQRFYSHRRDKSIGRMATLIWLS